MRRSRTALTPGGGIARGAGARGLAARLPLLASSVQVRKRARSGGDGPGGRFLCAQSEPGRASPGFTLEDA